METLLDGGKIENILSALTADILGDPVFAGGVKKGSPLALVGIRSRGEILAQRIGGRLAERLGTGVDIGALDITLYRDDLDSRGAIAVPRGTEMNFRLDDRAVILVDDVLATGRSVRAALDALVDFGRPRFIRLAVLIDRGGREYPIEANYIGLHVPNVDEGRNVRVKLRPTDPEDAVFVE